MPFREFSPYTSWAVHCLRAYAAYCVLLSVLPGTDPADSGEAFSSAVGLAIWSMIVRRYPRGGKVLTAFVFVTRGVAALVQLASERGALWPATMLQLTVLAAAVWLMLTSTRRTLALAGVATFALAILYGCFDIVAHQDQRQARRAAYRNGAVALRKTCQEASLAAPLRQAAAALTLPAVAGGTPASPPSKLNLLSLDDAKVSWNGEPLAEPEQLASRLASLLPPEPMYLAIDARTPVQDVVGLLPLLGNRPLRALVDGARPPLLAAKPPGLLDVFASAYRDAHDDKARTQLVHAELARLTVRCPESLFVLAKPVASHAQLADDLVGGLERCPVGAVDLESLRYVLLTPLHGEVPTPSELEITPAALEHVTTVQQLWQGLRAQE